MNAPTLEKTNKMQRRLVEALRNFGALTGLELMLLATLLVDQAIMIHQKVGKGSTEDLEELVELVRKLWAVNAINAAGAPGQPS